MRQWLLWFVPVLAGTLGLAVLPAVQAAAAVTERPAVSAVHARNAGHAPNAGKTTIHFTVSGDAFVPLTSATLTRDIWAKPGAPAVVTVRGKGGVPIAGVPGAGVQAVVLQVQVSNAPSAGQLVAYSASAAQPGAVSLSYSRIAKASQLVVVPLATGRRVRLAVSTGPAKLAVAVTGYYAAPGTATGGAGFVPVRPARVASVGPLQPNVTGLVRVTSKGGVPNTGVRAVVAEVSAVHPAAAGTLSVYPAGSARPAVPAAGFAPGVSATGLVIVKPGAGGKIALTAAGGATRATVDVLGYYPVSGTGAQLYLPVKATRIASGSIAAGQPQLVSVTGTSVVPAIGVKTVLLTVTASGATKAATLTAYSSGTKAPAVTSLSVGQGGTATGLIPVPPGTAGNVTLAISAGSANVRVDAVGYYSADPPAAPVTGLRVTGKTPWSTVLNWTPPAAGGDIVIRRAAGHIPPATITSGTGVATLAPGTAAHTVTGLNPATVYAYSVFATDSINAVAKAATLLVKTPAAPGPCTDGFIGAASSAWGDAVNWSTGKVPAATDWACVPAGAAHLPATTGTAAITVAGFTNQGGLTVNGNAGGTYVTELRTTKTTQPSTSSGPLTLEGSLNAAGPVTVTGTLSLISGQLTVPDTLTVAAGGALQAPAQGIGSGLPPLQVAAGSLVNQGTGTIGARVDLNVLAGASFTNDGTLTADSTSDLTVAAGGTLSDDGQLTAGGLTVQAGATLTVAVGAALDVAGDSSFAAAVSAIGPVTVSGALTVGAAATFHAFTLESGATLELSPGTTVHATAPSFAGGTLELVATASGNFGEFIATGTVNPDATTLNLHAPAYAAACGTRVTALSADSVTDDFGALTVDSLSTGGGWLRTLGATLAGGLYSCA